MRHAQRLYPKVVGAAWRRLHPAIQDVHTWPGPVCAVARFAVRRRCGRLAGLLLDLARVPVAGEDISVRLTVDHRDTPSGPCERWQRVFAGRPLVTFQAESPGGLLAERVGPLEFRFRLTVDAGSLVFRQVGCWLRLGPASMRLPRRLAPVVWCRETGSEAVHEDAVHETVVTVTVTAAGGGLLFSYHGAVAWEPGAGGS